MPDQPRRFAILLFPGFPMMAFSAVFEPLRAANRLSGRALFSWHTVSALGRPVIASSGISLNPDFLAEENPPADDIVVCSGGDADQVEAGAALHWIRRKLRRGARVGSVADGAFFLARAGLLDGFACTLHWTSQPAFAEAFPQVALKRDLYVIDRTRFTSAGGVGALDMMLDIIGRAAGEPLAQEVAAWFVHDRLRPEADREKLQLRLRTGIRDPLVLAAVRLMEEQVEQAPGIAALARQLAVPAARLERAFQADQGLGPGAYYRRLRLEKAQDLLAHARMPVQEVAMACGYADVSAFIRAFRKATGHAPTRHRRA